MDGVQIQPAVEPPKPLGPSVLCDAISVMTEFMVDQGNRTRAFSAV
jgi:hypothetical protein